MGGSVSRIDKKEINPAANIPESSAKKLYNSIVRIEIDLNEKEKIEKKEEIKNGLQNKKGKNFEEIKQNSKKISVDKYLNISKLINIKSKYIIKIIFSYLDEKVKLKTIKYNKKLQKKMNINLKNYKFFSGRYIEYETNKKGKEYNAYNSLLI